MKLPEDPGGSGSGTSVGGDTDAIEAGARTLKQEAGKVAPVARQISTAGQSASGAAGDPGATQAVSTFATAWMQFTTDLAEHLTALSTLAQVGSDDLRLATSGPGVKVGSYPYGSHQPGKWPKNLNPRFPGMPPGWSTPMRNDYVPGTQNPVIPGLPVNNPLNLPTGTR